MTKLRHINDDPEFCYCDKCTRYIIDGNKRLMDRWLKARKQDG